MKKFLSRLAALTLAAMLSLPLCAPALAQENAFSDVPSSHWAYNAILECSQLGIVTAFEDGAFRPEQSVSYVQFLVMLTRTFYSGEVEEIAAQDNAGMPWYYPNTQTARTIGLDKATDAVNKGGWPQIAVADAAISRYEMAKVIYNLLAYEGQLFTISSAKIAEAAQALTDLGEAPASEQGCIKACYAAGIILGMSDGTFSGSQPMTRAEACTVMVRMLERLNSGSQRT